MQNLLNKSKVEQKNYINYFLAMVAGSFLSLAFPPMPLFPLAFIAFVPLFIIQKRDETISFKYVYVTFFIYHLSTNWWISSWQDTTDPYLFWSGIILDVLHPFFFFIPFIISRFLNKFIDRDSLIALFPLIWVIGEWINSLGDLGYPWQSVAYTQFNNSYWFQIVDIAGIWGASLLVLYINVFVYKVIEQKIIYNKNIFRVDKGKNLIFAALVCLFIILPIVYGISRVSEFDYNEDIKNHKTLKIGLIQPNIDPWDKWEKSAIEQINLHFRLQDSLIKQVGNVDLFIWNETAIPTINLDINRDLHFYSFMQQLQKNNAALLTGFTQYECFDKNSENLPATARPFLIDTSQVFCSYNSAILLNPKKKDTIQVYHKQKLTPFAEGIPYVEYLSFAQKWLKWGVGISTWEKGKEIINFDLNNIAIAPIICIESIYPNFVRKFVLSGAEIITVITNDAWYNYTTGPIQHYIIAATRAIENRRYLARCANSGISGFISPTGKTVSVANQYEEAALAKTLPALTNKTLYTLYGDYLPIMCIVLIAVFIGLQYLGRKFHY